MLLEAWSSFMQFGNIKCDNATRNRGIQSKPLICMCYLHVNRCYENDYTRVNPSNLFRGKYLLNAARPHY